MLLREEQEVSRIARNSVNGGLNRNTCSGAEVALVQCKRGLNMKVEVDRHKTQCKERYQDALC